MRLAGLIALGAVLCALAAIAPAAQATPTDIQGLSAPDVALPELSAMVGLASEDVPENDGATEGGDSGSEEQDISSEGSDDSAEESSSDDESSGDAVDDLISKMMSHGQVHPQKLHALGDTGSKIALANENTVHKEGSQDDTQEEISREAATKKAFEATHKQDSEARHKIVAEANEKTMDIKRREIKQEERNKNFQDDLALKTEQSAKSNREEARKAGEQSTKAVKAAQREADAQKKKAQRDKAIQQAKHRAAEMTNKDKANYEKQKAQEQIKKDDLKAHRKRQEAARKFELENAKKKNEEDAEKKKAKLALAKKQEEHTKEMKKRMEASAKAQEKIIEREEKERKKHATGKTCQCKSVRVHFNHNNRWHNCPAGYLVTGIYRGRYHNLANIYYYRCCRPCKDDGRQVMQVDSCQTANWLHSFDRQGWSYCPSNTYIQGFYKSSCNWIYCLEYARCCKIRGSRARQSCGQKSWWSSFDRQGWSFIDANRFMIGLYRTGGHALYNIEMPNQCTYYAYTL